MPQQIQLRRGTAAAWTSANPILMEGELGLETDTMAYKIGDGATAWNSLAYRELTPALGVTDFTNQADPSAPGANTLSVYAKSISGRMMMKHKGPSGLDTIIQPAIFGNGIMMVSPGLTTAFNYLGMGALTAVGTVSHPVLVSTDQRQSTRRGIVTSAATADSAAELRHAVLTVWRGDTAGLGGFFVTIRFAVSSTTANQRLFVGLSSSTTALATTTAPGALTSCIGVGWDSADTNIQVISNDASGAATKVDLGASFPVNTPTDVYELTLYAKPNDTVCNYRLKNLVSGAEAAGTIADADLPATTQFLALRAHLNNGGTAAAVVFELMRMYVETDY